MQFLINSLETLENALQQIIGYAKAKGCAEAVRQHENGRAKPSAEWMRSIDKSKSYAINVKKVFRKEDYMKMPYLQNCSIRMKKGGYYEIRYSRKGVHKSFSSKKLSEAKKKCFDFLERIENGDVPEAPKPSKTDFNAFGLAFLENIKKPYLVEQTYKKYLSEFNQHIAPHFAGHFVEDVKPMDIQLLVKNIEETGHTRTLEDIRSLLNQIFEYAVQNELRARNPILAVRTAKHIRSTGKALTTADEVKLLKAIEGKAQAPYILIILYSGVRVCELPTVEFQTDFIRCENRKRKTKVKEFKRIPITPMLRQHLPAVCDFNRSFRYNWLEQFFFALELGYTLKDLRHTFITRCQTCGVPREVVATWAGHSAGNITGKVYTHYDDAYLLSLAELVKYPL